MSNMRWAWWVGGLVIVGTLLRPFTIVGVGQRGVVTILGQVQDGVLSEGLHTVIPVVTRVESLSVRIQKTELEIQAASSDLQEIKPNVVINWHLDPERVNEVYQQVGELDTVVTSIITPAISEVVKAATVSRSVEAILQERVALKQEIDAALTERLERYGIIVDDVSLVNLGFSPEFYEAIEAKQVAEQEAQQARYGAEKANQEANAEINRARGQAEAQRLLNQTLTPEILQQRAIEKWDGHLPTIVSGDAVLPLINLDPQALSQESSR